MVVTVLASWGGEPKSKRVCFFRDTTMTTKERRRYVRVGCLRFVEFVVEGRTYHGTIENKGEGGVFIKTKEHFSAGQDISMTYESSIFIRKKRAGKIVRITPHGIGVEFNYPGYTR